MVSSTIEILRAIRREHSLGSEILGCVRDCVGQCESRSEAEWALAAALYWISADWHGGMGDPLYLGQCGEFRPGPSHRSVHDEEDWLAASLYEDLESLFEGEVSS